MEGAVNKQEAGFAWFFGPAIQKGIYNSNVMEQPLSYSRVISWVLLIFAAVAVASISLQNLIWVAVALFFFAHYKDRLKINWPGGLLPWASFIFLATFFLGAVLGVDPGNSFHTVHKYLAMLMIFPLGAMALGYKEIRKLLLALVLGATVCAFFGIGKHFFMGQDRITSFPGTKWFSAAC